MGDRRLLVCALIGAIGCGKVNSAQQAPDGPVISATVSSLEVTPTGGTVKVGATLSLTATATFSDATSMDVTSSATWSAIAGTGTATVVGGVVSGVLVGDVTIQASLDGETGMVTVHVAPPPNLFVSNFSSSAAPMVSSIGVFPLTANGNVVPQRAIIGTATTFGSLRGIVVVNDTIVVVDQGTNSIDFFPVDANGNVAPSRQIKGAATLLNSPCGLTLVGTELFVVNNGGGLRVFDVDQQGDVAPKRVLDGGIFGQWVAVDNNELYFTDFNGGSIKVFPMTAVSGDPPSRTITGPSVGLTNPTGIAIHNGEIFVADTRTGTDEIRVFPETATGDMAPLRVISGANTGLGFPDQLAIFNNEIYVSNFDTNSVRVFPIDGNGDIVPTRSIVGSNTNFTGTLGAFIF